MRGWNIFLARMGDVASVLLEGMVGMRDAGETAAFDQARDAAVVARYPMGLVEAWNSAATTLFGRSAAEAVGRPLRDLFEDERIAAQALLCAQGPDGTESLETLYAGVRRPDGIARYIEVRFCRLEESDGSGPAVMLLARESAQAAEVVLRSSEQKAESRLQQLLEDAQEHRLLFGQAAHEFNTPLMVIQLEARILEQTMPPEAKAQRRALALIDRSVRRLNVMSRDLLDVARAEGGKLVLELVTIPLADFLAEEVEAQRDVAASQGVGLSVELGDGEARADRCRLSQVLTNLIGNALKFTPAGGHVTVRAGAGASGTVVVEVSDDGPGLNEDEMRRLFNPFTRVARLGTPARPGTGLGLYISRRLVEAMGGTVGCRSLGPGKGATFWCTLPRASTRPARPRTRLAPPLHRGAGAQGRVVGAGPIGHEVSRDSS